MFGDFVADDATDCRTRCCASQAAAQHIARNTAYHCTRCNAFFPRSHARAATQYKEGHRHGDDGQWRSKA